jgi:gluconolactonase
MGVVSLDPKTKQAGVIVGGYRGKKFNGPNDLTIDPKGNSFFSDPWGTSVSNPTGSVYRWDAKTGQIDLFMEHLVFPNGILLSPDEQFIYLCEFGQNRILRAPLCDGRQIACFFTRHDLLQWRVGTRQHGHGYSGQPVCRPLRLWQGVRG